MEDGKMEPLKTKRLPRSIYILLTNIFFERYSMLGISTILPLYLNRKLNFDQNASTAIFHTSELLAYLFPIIGAIVADSWLGHYKTIAWMLFMFVIGSVTLTIASIESLGLPVVSITLIGLFISVIGSGCTRANMTAYGGNQYHLPDEKKQLAFFFTIQIFAIRLGALVGRAGTPLMKENVKCFGDNDCYPFAFGVGTVAVTIGFLLILCGKSSFINKPLSGNMFVKVIKCITNGISEKFKRQKTDPKPHWLDYAEEKHGLKLVAETKNVVNILTLYLPIPAYWAVYQLQGSRWVFQASRMNGDIGFYTIQPDQMFALNSILGLLAIPINEYIFYPLLAKAKITTLLQKMAFGGVLASIASICAALVQMKVEKAFVSILWAVPQYTIAAFSDNFMYNSHLSFAYNEASESMKSVMTSFVFLVIAGGNVIVIIVSSARIFDSLVTEFFFFGGLLFASMILFAILARRYKPID